MTFVRGAISLIAGVLGLWLTPALAQASQPYRAQGFRYASSNYVVHENAGVAVITITRGNARPAGKVGFFAIPGTAVTGGDFKFVKAELHFAPGQRTGSFLVPIVNHHQLGPSVTVKLGMFDGYPVGLATPRHATLTIVNDDVVSLVRNPLNPLGLTPAPASGDPLLGGTPYVDWKNSPAAELARRWLHRRPRAAAMLKVISTEPSVSRYGTWDGRHVGLRVSHYLAQAARLEPGRVPELSTYNLSSHGCHRGGDPPGRIKAYHNWIRSLARGIGTYRAVMFLEMDSIITTGCLGRHGLAMRLSELRDAVNVLSRLPHLVVYLDAGAADALGAKRTAQLLRQANISKIQGFFVNSTHFDWTLREIRYGKLISRLVGGKHFVVNTAENGQGPLRPRDRAHRGNEVLCNPRGRGLGPKPTFDTGLRNVDAFAWISYPGQSDGACRPGAPKVGAFWPAWALDLVRRANFRVR